MKECRKWVAEAKPGAERKSLKKEADTLDKLLKALRPPEEMNFDSD